jgi:hypothetical protein
MRSSNAELANFGGALSRTKFKDFGVLTAEGIADLNVASRVGVRERNRLADGRFALTLDDRLRRTALQESAMKYRK